MDRVMPGIGIRNINPVFSVVYEIIEYQRVVMALVDEQTEPASLEAVVFNSVVKAAIIESHPIVFVIITCVVIDPVIGGTRLDDNTEIVIDACIP